MVEKLFMTAPRVPTPDYAPAIRQAMAPLRGDDHAFAQALSSQTERQSSVPAESASTSHAAGAKQLEKRPADAYPGGGIALDQRSLATLQRLEQQDATTAHVKKSPSGQAVFPPTRREKESAQAQGDSGEALGRLSAKYESGSAGIAAVGYDGNGGTSYGKYQISSRQGTFKRFLAFLAEEAPEIGERLRKAGNANTGGRRGAVPEAWKAIAAEQPERFEKLQEAFIRDSHYEPALEGVKETLGAEALSPAMQEVLWSTAVQHGPAGARRLFGQAVKQLKAQGKNPANEEALIQTVYALRKTQFSSSSASVQAAVRQRFQEESRQALAMLKEQNALG